MAVLRHKFRIASFGLVIATVAGMWFGLAHHEQQVTLPEVETRDPYKTMLQQVMKQKAEPTAKAVCEVVPPMPENEPEDGPEFTAKLVQSSENLRIIAQALREYATAHGSLPPAVVRDKEGTPLYSWRVLILPYLEKGEEVFRQFHLDEPWNSPINRRLLARMPPAYAPVRRTTREVHGTFYQVVTGPGTVFGDNPQAALRNPDAAVLVEAGEAVPWTKPVDVLIASTELLPRLGGLFKVGYHVAFADGKTLFVPRTQEDELLRDFFVSKKQNLPDRLELLRQTAQLDEGVQVRMNVAQFWIGRLRNDDPNIRRRSIQVLTEMSMDAQAVDELRDEIPFTAPALAAALADEDREVRERSEQCILQLGAAAVPALVDALKHSDYEVRGAAADILRRMPPDIQASLPAVKEQLAGRAKRLRTAWAVARNNPEDHDAVLAVLEGLKDRDAYVHSGVLYHLNNFGSDAKLAIPMLVRALGECSSAATADSDGLRQEIIHSLGELGPAAQPAIPALVECCERYPLDPAAGEALVKIGPAAIPALIESLHRSGDHQATIMEIIGSIGPAAKDAVPDLVLILKKDKTPLRPPAAQALGKIGPEARPAIAPLARALDDSDSQLRFQASLALVRIDPTNTAARPILVKRLADEDGDVALEAAAGLAHADPSDKAAVDYLVAAVRSNNSNTGEDTPRSPAAHLHSISDLASHRRKAASALAGLGSQARSIVPALMEAVLDDLNGDAAVALVQIDSEAAVPVLLQACKDSGRSGLEAVLPALEKLGSHGKEAVPHLVELLKQPRVGRDELHERAASLLARLDPVTAIPFLLKGLRGETSSSTYPYYQALRELDGAALAQILPELIRLVKDSNETMQGRASILLVRVGKPAVPMLIEMLGSADAGASLRAADILGRIGSDALPACPRLVKMADAKEPWVRRSAISAVARIAPRDAATIGLLTAGMNDSEASVRRHVTKAAGGVGPQAVGLLERALGDADAEVRCEAVRACTRIGQDGINLLIKSLHDQHFDVRRVAVICLGATQSKNEAIMTALNSAFKDDDRLTRQLAIMSLCDGMTQGTGSHEGSSSPVQSVALLLKDRDQDVRWLAAYCLGTLGKNAQEAVPALMEAVQDPSLAVRRAAVHALGEIGPDARAAIPALRIALENSRLQVTSDAVRALAHIGPEATKLLADELRNEDRKIRAEAADALIQVGPAAVPALFEKLKDPARDTSTEAAISLGRIAAKAETAVPAVIDALHDKDDFVRGAAARAVGEIGPDARQAVPDLVQLLNHPDPTVRWNAIWALGRIGADARSALPSLREAQKDTDPLNRSAATDAVKKIAADAAGKEMKNEE